MINKQSMVDHIRKIKAEAAQKHAEAMASQGEASRLTKILTRDIRAGNGTTGDPALDFSLTLGQEIDGQAYDAFNSLREKWNAHPGEYFLFHYQEYASLISRASVSGKPRTESIYLGRVAGELEFDPQDVSINLPISRLVRSELLDRSEVAREVLYEASSCVGLRICGGDQLRALYRSYGDYVAKLMIGDAEVEAWPEQNSFLYEGPDRPSPLKLMQAALAGNMIEA